MPCKVVSLSPMLDEKQFISSPFSACEGHAIWSSPSNIALVKYWGKYGNQLPQNPSLSFTLTKCCTTTSIRYTPIKDSVSNHSFSFLFEGKTQTDFHPKITSFFERIAPFCPYISSYHLEIESSNSFPHSSGIASSASSMSALALAVLSIERQANPQMTEAYFYQKASFLARLGSGSAARSISGPIMSWGETTAIAGSSQLFGLQMTHNIHPIFKDYQDTILIIDKGQKKVSSTLGHDLMTNHPYATQRFSQAHENITRLLAILSSGHLSDFIALVESEALTLHALMMASDPYFVLMQPQTLSVLNKVWEFRASTGLPLCFTLDAGANVHLLYPKENSKKIKQFIQNELKVYCQNGQYIEDQIGTGSKKL